MMNICALRNWNGLTYLRRFWARWLLIGLLCFLPACSPSSTSGTGTGDLALDRGFNSPEAVVLNFFEDLNSALRDPHLSDRQARIDWVEKLVIYFAPNERDDQREALGQALYTFSNGEAMLSVGQSLKLEIRCNSTNCNDNIQKVSDDGTHAAVRLNGGSIYMLISHGSDIDLERDVPLSNIIGRADGTIPLIKVGRSWYLTES